MNKIEALEQCTLFSGISAESKKFILNDERAVWQSIDTGEFVFKEKENAEPELIILVSGTLLVFREHGEAKVLLNEIKAPGIVGAAALFGDEESHLTTVMAKKRCQALVLPQSLLSELIKKDGDFAVCYISFLSDRIRFLNRRIASFTSGSAVSRLSGYLIGRSTDGRCEISRTRLAAELDIGRASLYRALDTLADEKIISTDGKTIIILDEDRLAIFAQESK